MITGKRKGIVLVIVLASIALMLMSTVFMSTMVQRDVRLIEKVKENEQARFLAEAGISHAIAEIKSVGLSSVSDFDEDMDTGSYEVTFSTIGTRTLVTSVGKVPGSSKTVSIEVAGSTPTALNYLSGAGNDIKINALVANATINGDIHANNNVYLKSGFIFSWLTITGNVSSAAGVVQEGTKLHQGSSDLYDNHVVINEQADDTATIYEGEAYITFPVFDYSSYQQDAIAYGDYYSSSQEFNSQTLSPASGLVYVEGDVHFNGNCTLNGGVVADSITITGALSQNKSGTKNVIIAKTGDIKIAGNFSVEEALVYASQDVSSIQVLANIEVTGILLAGRDIDMWNVITYITYNYASVVPSGVGGSGSGGSGFTIVSGNS